MEFVEAEGLAEEEGARAGLGLEEAGSLSASLDFPKFVKVGMKRRARLTTRWCCLRRTRRLCLKGRRMCIRAFQ